jgi:uroporphyrin-III C-methyltransferase/precorrin-2 dehydrogenase/sirohydrochlorin ferrochelatase
MALSRIDACCRNLVAAGRDPDCPAVLIENGTTHTQRIFRATLTSLPALIANEAVQSPALLIAGDVTALAAAGQPDRSTPAQDPWLAPASPDPNVLM